jgi:hypothetical protein
MAQNPAYFNAKKASYKLEKIASGIGMRRSYQNFICLKNILIKKSVLGFYKPFEQ